MSEQERYSAAEFQQLFERRGRIYVRKGQAAAGTKGKPVALGPNGLKVRSYLEAQIAGDLEVLKRAKLIRAWKYEPRFDLPAQTLTGRTKSHRVDFEVTLNSGAKVYLEGKGYRWRDGETRRQWVEDRYGIRVHVVETRREAQGVMLGAIRESEGWE